MISCSSPLFWQPTSNMSAWCCILLKRRRWRNVSFYATCISFPGFLVTQGNIQMNPSSLVLEMDASVIGMEAILPATTSSNLHLLQPILCWEELRYRYPGDAGCQGDFGGVKALVQECWAAIHCLDRSQAPEIQPIRLIGKVGLIFKLFELHPIIWSWQYETESVTWEPTNILPSSCFDGTVTWGIQEQGGHANQGLVPFHG